MLLNENTFTVLRRSEVSVHVITTGKGIPVEFMVTVGSIHDNTTFQVMAINLPKKNTWAEELENRYYRKTIENTRAAYRFAEINAKFPKKIHAVTAKGFLLKIRCFIIMYILDKQFLV
jgi:hypothetical protein